MAAWFAFRPVIPLLKNAVIRKELVYWFCGSDFPVAIVLIRGWKAAPTGVLFSNLGLPDKRMKK